MPKQKNFTKEFENKAVRLVQEGVLADLDREVRGLEERFQGLNGKPVPE